MLRLDCCLPSPLSKFLATRLVLAPFSSTSASLTCQPPSPESRLCIRQRPSNHACWWRLTNSGRGVKQRHGNRRWILPDVEVKAQYYKSSVNCLHLNNKEDKRELKVNHNNETLLFCSEPTYLGGMLDRTVTYQWWSLETWSRHRDVSRDPFFQVGVGFEYLRSRLGLEGFRSRALSLDTLHELFFLWSLARNSSFETEL